MGCGLGGLCWAGLRGRGCCCTLTLQVCLVGGVIFTCGNHEDASPFEFYDKVAQISILCLCKLDAHMLLFSNTHAGFCSFYPVQQRTTCNKNNVD